MKEAKPRILVVANRTACSEELLNALRRRADTGPASFSLLVPATPRGVSWATDMHAGAQLAEAHRQAAVERFRRAGLDVGQSMVGDADPLAAVQDAVNLGSFDEIIVSTLPKHLSKWLHLDLPRRIAHATRLEVTHVEAHEAEVAVGA